MLVLVKFQLMAMNKVTAEDVSMFLTAALVGLQKHGQHESVQPVLLTLALRIYELAVSLTDLSHRRCIFSAFDIVALMT